MLGAELQLDCSLKAEDGHGVPCPYPRFPSTGGAREKMIEPNESGEKHAQIAKGRRTDARRTAEMVARRSYGKLVAFLAARTRDVAAAEDALCGRIRLGS